MQNAADASVISGAIWEARGLNLISILNVGMTEALALIIMFKAFDSTLKYTKIVWAANVARYAKGDIKGCLEKLNHVRQHTGQTDADAKSRARGLI